MVVLTWEREAERGMGIWGETVIWGVERGIWGWWIGGSRGRWGFGWWRLWCGGLWRGGSGGGDLCLFCQARRVLRESGGGIGIAGEPTRCGEGDLGGGDLCLFCQARRVLRESGGGIGIAGEPAHCSVSVFFSWPLKSMKNYKIYYNLGFS